MELADTVGLMDSNSYKERFKAEYYQTKIRHDDLKYLLHRWNKGMLEVIPTCPKNLLEKQLEAMVDYLAVLEMRAYTEKIKL